MIEKVKKIKGGVSVHHQKITENYETVKMDLPKKVLIPMLQHIGAVCEPTVKKGDIVKVGQKIGDSSAFISSPIHSSVSGKVTNVKPMLYPGGFEVMSVEIETDGLQEVHESVKPPGDLSKAENIKAIRESGIVGLGGAGFPTSVKLCPPPGKHLDTLVINGAECEPYITSDYREMLENPDGIIEGTKIIMDLTGIKNAVVAIEKNKPEAIKIISQKVKDIPGITVKSLKTMYPQGAEKQLIYAITGRKVPSGKLPAEVAVLVQNINTASFIAEFMKTGMPLIKKKVTVDGSAVAQPKNVEVLIGTSLKDVFEFCGGFSEDPYKVIMGGPMMGVAQFSLENSVVKHTNALLAFNKKEAMLPEETECIRCGKCIKACPMGLMPQFINSCVVNGKIEEAEKYNALDCIECGCCSYACPANRHLVQSMRYGKAEITKRRKQKKQ